MNLRHLPATCCDVDTVRNINEDISNDDAVHAIARRLRRRRGRSERTARAHADTCLTGGGGGCAAADLASARLPVSAGGRQ